MAEDAAGVGGSDDGVEAAAPPNREDVVLPPAFAEGNLNGLEDACVVVTAVDGAAPNKGLLPPSDVAGVCVSAGAALFVFAVPNRELPLVAEGVFPNNGFGVLVLFCPNKLLGCDWDVVEVVVVGCEVSAPDRGVWLGCAPKSDDAPPEEVLAGGGLAGVVLNKDAPVLGWAGVVLVLLLPKRPLLGAVPNKPPVLCV